MSPAHDRPLEVGRTGARFGSPARRRRLGIEDVRPAAVEELTSQPVGPVVGLTGARFGPDTRRRHKGAKSAGRGSPPADTPPADTTPADTTPPDTTPADSPLVDFPPAESAASEPPADEAPPPDDAAATSLFVRPYVLTRGRTRSSCQFSIETLVSAVLDAAVHLEAAEHQAVVQLCRQPRSVAEVAALLRVPLGVARVLVGDLVGVGSLYVHESGKPDVALMERVLSGLRRL